MYGDGRYCYITTTTIITVYTPLNIPRTTTTCTHVYGRLLIYLWCLSCRSHKVSTFFAAIARPRRLAPRASSGPRPVEYNVHRGRQVGRTPTTACASATAPPYKPTLIPRASPSRQKLAGPLTGEAAWARTATDHDGTTRRRQVSARVRKLCPRGYSNPRHSSLRVQRPPSRR